MSQSPSRALRLQRYEDGWELINRMIREGASWGGRERNCFHLNLGGGRFAEISAACGLDSLDDGRALARLDVDLDGRPDLVLRNRTAPGLRILRNQWPHAGRALWIRLEGRRTNRDAIGARVAVRTSRGLRVQEVTAGRAFLSQSSRWLCFGLAVGTEVEDVTVRWPGGGEERLGPLAPEGRWRLVEGEAPRHEPLAGRRREGLRRDRGPAAPGTETPGGAGTGSIEAWLLEPLPAPPFAWRNAAGETVRLEALRGRPAVIHFLSRTCGVCREELPRLLEGEEGLERVGARSLYVSVDLGEPLGRALAFLQAAGDRAVEADERGLLAWNVVHRELFNLRRDLAVPTAFLLDRQGRIAKVYRGRMDPAVFERDARRLPREPGKRRELALPFPGRVLGAPLRRDLLSLGSAFAEAGLAELARATLEPLAAGPAADPDALFNYAVSIEKTGDAAGARAVYLRILQETPEFDDACNNLGILEARAGKAAAAREHFRRVFERNPAHTEAALNLGKTYMDEGRPEEAEKVYRRALEEDPESALLWRHLALARYERGRLEEAVRLQERALEIDPDDLDGRLNLAILHMAAGHFARARDLAAEALEGAPEHAGLRNVHGMALRELGEVERAAAELRRAIAADPDFDRPYLNLARTLTAAGRREEAREVLGELLRRQPENERALELAREIGAR